MLFGNVYRRLGKVVLRSVPQALRSTRGRRGRRCLCKKIRGVFAHVSSKLTSFYRLRIRQSRRPSVSAGYIMAAYAALTFVAGVCYTLETSRFFLFICERKRKLNKGELKTDDFGAHGRRFDPSCCFC